MFIGTKIDLQGSENKLSKARLSIAPLSYEEVCLKIELFLSFFFRLRKLLMN